MTDPRNDQFDPNGPEQERHLVDTHAPAPEYIKEPLPASGGMTREMKMLVAALPLLLLLGGLAYYLNSTRNAEPQADTSAAPAQVDPVSPASSAAETSESAAAPATGSEASGASATGIPALKTATAGTRPAEVGGINPDEPLAAVPSRNPFRPLALQVDPNAPTPTTPLPTPQASGSAPAEFSEPSVAVKPSVDSSWSSNSGSAGSSDAGSYSSSWSSGNSDTSLTAKTPSSSVSITSTGQGSTGKSSSGMAASTSTKTISNKSGAAAKGSSSTAGRASSPAAAGSTSGAMEPWNFEDPAAYPPATVPAGASGSASQPSAPKPTVAGVTEPSLGAIANRPERAGSAAAPANANRSSAGTSTPEVVSGTAVPGVSTPALSVPLPAPSQPSLVTQYGGTQGVSAPDNGTALSRAMNRQNLRFTGAVLGPSNTAIFRDDQGFMVLSEGDRLPNTEIRVQDITASTVTLALGSDTLTLQLNPLQQ